VFWQAAGRVDLPRSTFDPPSGSIVDASTVSGPAKRILGAEQKPFSAPALP